MDQSTLTRLTLDYVMARDASAHLCALLAIAEYLGALGNGRSVISQWLSYSDQLLPEDRAALAAVIETQAIIMTAQGKLRCT